MTTKSVWKVGRDEAGQRLDRFLQQAMAAERGAEAPSRRLIRRWIDEGRVAIGGRGCRVASRSLQARQRVEVDETSVDVPTGVRPGAQDPPDPTRPHAFELTSAHVVFEDAHLLVVDKPTGIASQGTPDDDHNHLLAAAGRWLLSRGGGFHQGPWLHHRLDRGTSGLVLLAKSRAANGALGRAFGERRIDKRYSVLVLGQPPAAPWRVDAALRRVRGEGGRAMSQVVMERQEVSPGDDSASPVKEAVTEVLEVESFAASALLRVHPLTGRMHQIRVHLAAVGNPVLGDRLYGDFEAWRLPSGEVPRPMLHATSLRLRHPVNGRPLELSVPPPPDMQGWIDRLRGDQPPNVP